MKLSIKVNISTIGLFGRPQQCVNGLCLRQVRELAVPNNRKTKPFFSLQSKWVLRYQVDWYPSLIVVRTCKNYKPFRNCWWLACSTWQSQNQTVLTTIKWKYWGSRWKGGQQYKTRLGIVGMNNSPRPRSNKQTNISS